MISPGSSANEKRMPCCSGSRAEASPLDFPSPLRLSTGCCSRAHYRYKRLPERFRRTSRWPRRQGNRMSPIALRRARIVTSVATLS